MTFIKKASAMLSAIVAIVCVSSVSVSAASFSFYISNSGSYTSTSVTAGYAAHDGYVNVSYNVQSLANGCGVSQSTYVGGTYVGGNSYSSTNTYPENYSHSYIDKGERILSSLSLNPAPYGLGSSASGSVTGS